MSATRTVALCVRALCIGAFVTLAPEVDAQTTTPPLATRYAGCYRLSLGPWSGPLPPTGIPAAHLPPPSFRLDTVYLKIREGFAVEPAHLVPGRIEATWTSSNDSVHVIWSTKYVGVTLSLAARGDSLVGVATTFHDVHIRGKPEPQDPSAPAVARRTMCAAR